ncbi:MAG TPA: gamma carbonic anhydrase family protein [Polyangiaceae bacterium]|jgi:carbonic anhydrase/acetyltransferase-like protein (isoleucine patch superfamily)|nr:gamma carbonic anhydrase family protein [Polyangiaceae bacterium]
MGQLLSYDGATPALGRDVFIAPGAYVIGKVTLGDESSVWFGAVLRGDVGAIVIGARTNIQDLSVIHMTGGVSDVRIGDDVTVGHRVTLHGCDIGHRCLVGMGSILLDGVRVGDDSVIAAGSLITSRMVIPAGSLVLGRPAKVLRPATAQEKRLGIEGAAHYVENARTYRALLAATAAKPGAGEGPRG